MTAIEEEEDVIRLTLGLVLLEAEEDLERERSFLKNIFSG